MTLKIVAEAGCNWRAMDEARVFINRCKDLNIDYCKFQIYNDDNIKDNPNKYFLQSIMIGKEEAQALVTYGKRIGQKVVFSVMYPEALRWYDELKCDFVKIRLKDNREDWVVYRQIKTPIVVSVNFNGQCHPDLYPLARLKCVPEYPADIVDYLFEPIEDYDGVSDHTNNCDLLKHVKRYHDKYLAKYDYDFYFEKHVKLTNACLEWSWSVSFGELWKVLG